MGANWNCSPSEEKTSKQSEFSKPHVVPYRREEMRTRLAWYSVTTPGKECSCVELGMEYVACGIGEEMEATRAPN